MRTKPLLTVPTEDDFDKDYFECRFAASSTYASGACITVAVCAPSAVIAACSTNASTNEEPNTASSSSTI